MVGFFLAALAIGHRSKDSSSLFLIYVKPTESPGNILTCAGRYPELRSSLRKPGQRDSASLTSTSSSKKSVRLALGGEMTAV